MEYGMSLETLSLRNLPTLTKDHRLRVVSDNSQHLEPPLSILDEAVTPVERWFVRNNQPVPSITDEDWELSIDGLVRYPLTINMRDLLHEPTSSFFAALIGQQNHSNEYAMIANVEWMGTPLALLLETAGVKPQARIAACWSYGPKPVVRYLPLSKLWWDVMLAYAVNDHPLPAVHGGPVRLVVPGWKATYWLKWVSQITLLSGERLPTETSLDGELTIDCRFFNLSTLRVNTPTTLCGVAWSAANGIAQVALAVDEGAWQSATLDNDLGPRAWRRFSYTWTPTTGNHLLAVRVSDHRGQSTVRHWQVEVH
jgi:DMSO/TMAO reductase YedYZ molybdopterin-dependent catalytic subunit